MSSTDYPILKRFGDSPASQSASALTDNSGGTAGTTIAVIGATYSQSEVANAVASLAAQINNLKTTTDALIARQTK